MQYGSIEKWCGGEVGCRLMEENLGRKKKEKGKS